MGNALFEKIYPITMNDRDWCNRLTPTAVLNLAQDAALRHSKELHVGFDDLFSNGYLWVLVRLKYEVVTENISNLNEVKVISWPITPRGMELSRDFKILSSTGEDLIIGTSLWVIIDINSKTIQRSTVIEYNISEFINKRSFLQTLKKLPINERVVKNASVPYVVTYNEIDPNRHMNNTKYASAITNLLTLDQDENIKSFEINYLKELKYKETLELSEEREDNVIEITGRNKGVVSLRARVILKEENDRN